MHGHLSGVRAEFAVRPASLSANADNDRLQDGVLFWTPHREAHGANRPESRPKGSPRERGFDGRENEMAIIGYARVSTTGQDLGAQEDALREAGCERVYADHGKSGARASRPEWDRCREALRDSDTLVVTKLDRLGRSLRNVLTVVDELAAEEVALRILDLAADTSTASGRMVLSVLGAVAELERELARERTIAGLEAARRRGRTGGRPRVLDAERLRDLRQLVDGGMSVTRAAELIRVSRSTAYAALRGSHE